jgi:spore germination cell wall hydrolase CwlJ-like protein
MRTLREKSHCRLDWESTWKACGRSIVFIVLLLLGWVGISSATSVTSPNNIAHADAGDSYVSSSIDLSRSSSNPTRRAEMQQDQEEVAAAESKVSSHSATAQEIHDADALKCLALNIYWEARNQSVAGQLAVAQVTLNRVLDRRYSDDVCDVVYQHKQFSWYWDGKSDVPIENKAWERALLIASAALDGSGHVALQGVTHYHAVYSKPYWKDSMVRVTTIDDHIFYIN